MSEMIIIKDEQWIQQRNFQSHSQLKMIKTKILNAIFIENFLTSSLSSSGREVRCSASKKILSNCPKNMVLWINCTGSGWSKVEFFLTLETDSLPPPSLYPLPPPPCWKRRHYEWIITPFTIARDVFYLVRLLNNVCLPKSGNRYSFLVSILICLLYNLQ